MITKFFNRKIYHNKNGINKNCYWTRLRFFVGLILLVAAMLKAHQLATTPSLGEGLLHARWFNILVVGGELLFGLWLLFGLLSRLTWLAAVGCFSMFALVSFYKAFSGEDSCGCFGKVPVNPWITTSFDLLIIALLFYVKPNNIKNIFNDVKNINMLKCFFSQHYSRLILFVGIFLLLGGTVYTWIEQKVYDRLEHAGQVLKSNVVQLNPKNWIDKEFPLRDYIIDGREIMRGRWTVLLVRPGCGHCADVKKQLIQNSKQDQFSIAILDIVTKVPQPNISENIRNYRLHSGFTWVADTPVVLFLQDGIVQNVKLRE